jgi:hypothetical protein
MRPPPIVCNVINHYAKFFLRPAHITILQYTVYKFCFLRK